MPSAGDPADYGFEGAVLMTLQKHPEIAYLLPNLGISGGVSIVLSHISELRKRGRNAAVFFQNPSADGPWHYLLREVPAFPFADYYKVCGSSGAQHLVATWWMTAFDVAKTKAGNRHYFLQSLENRLYPEGHILRSTFFLSLLLNLNIFTEAHWIRDWLREHLHIDAPVVRNGIDPKVFYLPAEPKQQRDRLRVLIEGPPDRPLKGVAECFQAVSGLDVEVWYIASQGEPDPSWRFDRMFKAVPYAQMRDIYVACDVLLKMSRVEGFFGPPLEMMACGGTCVVGNVSGHEEYCVHKKNCLVVRQDSPDEARQAISALMHDRGLLQELQINALNTAQQHVWGRNIDILSNEIFSGRKTACRDTDQAIVESLIAIKEFIVPTVMSSPVREDFKGRVRQAVRALLPKKQ